LQRGKDIDEQLQVLERGGQKGLYLKLTRELLKELEINPHERGIAKSLRGMVIDIGESIDNGTILGILKEIQQLYENS
jgi:hypothetical protein